MNFEQFTKLLRYSWLVAPIEVYRLAAAYGAASNNSGEETTADGFGHYLVTIGQLTKWQCDKLLGGKCRVFYMDSYVLLEEVGRHDETSSFKALDSRDGKLVCLVVNRANRTDPATAYEVTPYIV